MRFSEIFDYHKIPEWYNEYLNYDAQNTQIENYHEAVKKG
jgi:hypothetical protein